MTVVLIVEDDVFINMEAIFLVGELGHATHCAHDYEAGLTILQSEARIDVLGQRLPVLFEPLAGICLPVRANVFGLCIASLAGARCCDWFLPHLGPLGSLPSLV